MFTGLIHHLGKVIAVTQLVQGGGRLVIESTLSDVQAGESIAVNGVCLTLLPGSCAANLMFDLSAETWDLTQLQDLSPQDAVHLEQALCAHDRMGGHVVTGHIDATLRLKIKEDQGQCVTFVFEGVRPDHRSSLVQKGCIALSGVSLTIHEVREHEVAVLLIPHTLEQTLFKSLELGQRVNVEYDYFAKLIAAQLKNLKD